MDYLAVLETVSLDRVGKVSRRRVAVASAEVRDEYAGPAKLHDLFSATCASEPGDKRPGSIFNRGGDAELVGHICIHEILLHHSIFHYIVIGRSYALGIEHLSAGFPGCAGDVHYVQPCGEKLLSERIRQEGVLLLDVECVQGTQDRIQHLLRDFAVDDCTVLPAPAAPGAYLKHGLFQGRVRDLFRMEAGQGGGCFPPSSAVFVAAGILDREFGEEFEGGLAVEGFGALGVHDVVVVYRVGVFSFLGYQLPIFPADGNPAGTDVFLRRSFLSGPRAWR